MNIIQQFLNETYSYIKQKSKISGYGMFAQWDIDKGGFAGCVIGDKFSDHGFYQVYVAEAFRGKGLLCVIAKAVFKKLKLNTMSSTILKRNVKSIKSHIKAPCFKPIDKEREKFLRGKGYLKPTEVRFDYAGK